MIYMSVIVLDNVSFTYGTKVVLDNISLSFKERDFVCFVGPNGGGKSTLLKIILGQLKPTKGKIEVFGKSARHSCHRIGYMPQHIHLDPKFPVTVLDIVLMGRLGSRFRWMRKKDRNMALNALDRLDMLEYAEQLFVCLSGGQRQRVLIARAIVSAPEILILDEPTAGVDAIVEQKLYHLMQELNKKMTIIFVSHDLHFVGNFVKTVVCIHQHAVLHKTSDLHKASLAQVYLNRLRIIEHNVQCTWVDHQ